MRAEIDRAIADINGNLGHLRRGVESFNGSLAAIASQRIEQRRTKLLEDRNLVANLGFAMKERADTPRTYAAPGVRRKINSLPPPASKELYKPEPILTDEDYEDILITMDGMTRVMECSPKAFTDMNEEDLRQHFLVQLRRAIA